MGDAAGRFSEDILIARAPSPASPAEGGWAYITLSPSAHDNGLSSQSTKIFSTDETLRHDPGGVPPLLRRRNSAGGQREIGGPGGIICSRAAASPPFLLTFYRVSVCCSYRRSLGGRACLPSKPNCCKARWIC